MRSTLDIKDNKGAALLIVIFFFIAISLAVIETATKGVLVELETYRTLATSKLAYVAAEAGVEDIFYRAINDKTIPASETISLNDATSTVTVTNDTATDKEAFVSGIANNEVRRLYLSISNYKSASFPYGAEVGEGGVTMNNNATIDGTGLSKGDIYSDGQVIGAPGVSVTGNVISASNLALDPEASSTVCTNDETVGRTNPNIDYAESFQISGTSSLPLAHVSLYIKRSGNPTGANVRITADAGGHPATTALASATLDYSLVSTSYGWVNVDFTAPATLDPATTYWIVVDTTQTNGKYWIWCRSASDTYTLGSPLYKQDWSTAGAWTAVAGDMAFELTLGGGVSKIDHVSVSGTAKADAITNSTISGDAYYQTISGSTVGGTAHPGSPTPPNVPLPISSTTIMKWKSDAEAGGTISGNCGDSGVAACNTFPLSLGPKKINGNLLVANGEVLTVTGTLYVTGTVRVSNNGKIQCAFAYVGNSCVIISDGAITISNNGILSGSGVAGSFLMMLTTIKGCYTGGSGTGCASNNSGIEVANNVSGALFYATDSMVDISNNAIVTAVVGYMLNLTNGVEIKYDPMVSALNFSSGTGGTGAWTREHWNEY